MTETTDLMRSHQSIRRFKDRPVPAETLREILSAARCASTSHFVQAFTVIQVTDPGVRGAISELAGFQKWVIQAPVFLVFTADLNRLISACRRHGKEPSLGYAEQLITATVDTALVAQNTMLAAESLGLGGVFVGGIRNDPRQVCDLLQIPEHAFPVFGMCLGWPDDDPGTKPRLPVDVILKTDRYTGVDDARLTDGYDNEVQAYYRTRKTNLKDETWSSQMADFMSQVIRPHMKTFLEEQGFFLR